MPRAPAPTPALRSSPASLREAFIERMEEDEVRWRSLGGLFVAGGVLAGVSVLFPMVPGARAWAIGVLALTAVLSGIGMIAAAGRLPRGDAWPSALLAFGTLLVTGAVYFTHAAASPYILLYVWVGFDGFFFLTRRVAYLHVVFVGVCYGAILLGPGHAGQAALAHWAMVVGTVFVIGTLADFLRQRSDRLIDRLRLAARTDALTGLLNRRGFEESMAEEIERARRSASRVSLVVGDLDHFKSLNDQSRPPAR